VAASWTIAGGEDDPPRTGLRDMRAVLCRERERLRFPLTPRRPVPRSTPPEPGQPRLTEVQSQPEPVNLPPAHPGTARRPAHLLEGSGFEALTMTAVVDRGG